MRNPKLIENKRVVLSDILRNNAPFHKHLSIATGYWDLAGTMEFLKEVSSYETINWSRAVKRQKTKKPET